MNVIIRPVSTICNLRCCYCYTRLEPEKQKNMAMSEQQLQLITRNFISDNCERINFLWHGGEPLLAGLPFLRKTLIFQAQRKEELQNRVIISNSLQTNGTLLNDEIGEFFKKNHFSIGVSIDGIEEVHNSNRLMMDGLGSHKLVVDGLNLLQRYEVKFGVVSVVTRKSLDYPVEILSFFISRGISNIHFLPYAEMNKETGKLDIHSINGKEYGIFLKKIFEYWKSLDNPLIKIRIIDNFLQGLLGGKMELCTFSRNCQSHILVETNGDTYLCGRNANNQSFFIGNALNDSFQNIQKSELFKSIANRFNAIPENCRNCKYINICKGGCAYFKFLLSGGKSLDKDLFCESYRILMDLIVDWLKKENMSISI